MTDTGSTAGLTVVHDAAELVVDPSEETDVIVLEDATLAAPDNEVVAISPMAEVLADYPVEDTETAVDATDRTVLPDFAGPRTHVLSAGDRSDEFVAELQGATYEDIFADDDGILHTVDAVRGVSDGELMVTLADHLDAVLTHGTTTVEVETNYGLDTEIELRVLSVVDAAGSDHPADVIPTFMDARAVPCGANAEECAESVISNQLPTVVAKSIAEFCDVLCERGVFITGQSHRILDTGHDHGLVPRIHADESTAIGGTDMATLVGATSTDHLLHTDDEGRDTLADAGATPVLLPDMTFSLGAGYTDARAFLDAGHEIALATGFSPNCFARSMSLIATFVNVGVQVTPHEAIRGVTSTAAGTLDHNDDTGTLRARAPTDAAVLDMSTALHLSYRFDTNPASTVLKSGVIARE